MSTLDELEEIRKRNLAKEDAAISAVNAVHRMRAGGMPFDAYARVAQYQQPGTEAATRYPGGAGKIDFNAGTVTGAVPTFGAVENTPLENLDIEAAMERADRGGRFGFGSPQYQQNTDTPEVAAPDSNEIDIGAINERRNQILQGIDPDRPAIFVNRKRRAELRQELGTLTNIAHQHAFTSAKVAHENLKKHRDIEVSTQVGNILSGLADIPPDGSPESAAKILKLKQDNLLGFIHSPAVQKELRTHATTHDKVSKERVPLVEKVAEKDLAKAGLAPEEFAIRANPRRGKIDEKTGEFTNQYDEAAKGDHVAVDIGGKTFSMPVETFQRLDKVIPVKTAVPAQPVAQTQPAGATATQTAIPAGTKRTINGVEAEWDGKGWKATKK